MFTIYLRVLVCINVEFAVVFCFSTFMYTWVCCVIELVADAAVAFLNLLFFFVCLCVCLGLKCAVISFEPKCPQ